MIKLQNLAGGRSPLEAASIRRPAFAEAIEALGDQLHPRRRLQRRIEILGDDDPIVRLPDRDPLAV